MDDGAFFDELSDKGSAADQSPRKPIRTYIEGRFVIKVYQTLYDSSTDNRYTVRPKHDKQQRDS